MRLWQAQAEGAALLRAAGIDGASRDADRILAAALGIEPGQLRIT
ncbi:MAG: peptide chain release factor N(5)-glutamine methyltransferase, partial [Paracoccus sp. (in: a-proteobacteria)]